MKSKTITVRVPDEEVKRINQNLALISALDGEPRWKGLKKAIEKFKADLLELKMERENETKIQRKNRNRKNETE